jgi:hypothetical protein
MSTSAANSAYSWAMFGEAHLAMSWICGSDTLAPSMAVAPPLRNECDL